MSYLTSNLVPWRTLFEATLATELHNPALCSSWLADHLQLSERQLARRLKKLYGRPTGRLIQEAKLQRAKELLLAPDRPPVRQVAGLLHYADVKYFSRLFRSRFGAYPSQIGKHAPPGG